ncbi:MAG: hypothetical protein NTV57_14465 [Cyanobacteria bacterium]|nr:hypothetical protein [Cyanobacteriota bacterium]
MFSSLLQKAGLRPGLALHSAIPKVLMAAAMVGGSGALLLLGGAARAQLTTPCTFGGQNPSCQINQWYQSNPASDKEIQFLALPNAGATGDIELSWTKIDPPNGYTDDTWDVDVDFNPTIVATVATGTLSGSFDYTMRISPDSPWTFRDVQLDATGTQLYNVTKKVYADAGFTTLVADLTVPPGPNPLGGPFPITTPLKQIWVRNTYTIDPGETLDNFQDSYRQRSEVPGPLPLMGAGMAFGFSRKLRSRIKSSASAKV